MEIRTPITEVDQATYKRLLGKRVGAPRSPYGARGERGSGTCRQTGRPYPLAHYDRRPSTRGRETRKAYARRRLFRGIARP